MPRDVSISVQNNFSKGLITETTGLNFPENACTETYDCVFDRTGLVRRRLGLDYEINNSTTTIDRDDGAMSKYYWKNVVGDNSIDLVVQQVGSTLHFWRSSTAQLGNALSGQHLASTVTISSFLASGGTFDATEECQFTDGNGYLFVTHPDCNPFYVSYASGTVTGTSITVKIRDFAGITETGVEDNNRPLALTSIHNYNLTNQGWGKNWAATSTTGQSIGLGTKSLVINSSPLPIVVGDRVFVNATVGGLPQDATTNTMTGIITLYSGTTIVFNVTSITGTGSFSSWAITPKPPYIYDWFRAISNYPSNADSWWFFKNSSDVFSPATTIDNVTTSAGAVPKGFYILEAFNQQRDTVSGLAGLTDVTTLVRPSTCAWFAGRIWYSGVKDKGFNESLYFSQIIEGVNQFGKCYQVNDPTSEERFDLLPSDGGEIRIQGAGTIYKLYSVQNGLLVFSDKGIWFITGSQGIGFTANDYSQPKVSEIRTMSPSSFINVQGYPMFWNEEGIYYAKPGEQGGLSIQSLTDSTIATFFQSIPEVSKRWARGDFDPLNNTIQWVYKSTGAFTTNTRYEFDRILNFNLQTGGFYPWTIGNGTPDIHDIMYIPAFFNSDSPDPTLKYITSRSNGAGSYTFTFSEERDTGYVDWEIQDVGVPYTSYFVTGYAIRGQGMKQFQQNYVSIHSLNEVDNSFKIQNQYNFSTHGNSGKWSTIQVFTNTADDFQYKTNRIKMRGQGLAYQMRVLSNSTNPFNIVGWSLFETGNKWI